MSSGNDFILLPGPDGGIYYVSFYDRHTDKPIEYSFNVTFLSFEGLLLQIPRMSGIKTLYNLFFVG